MKTLQYLFILILLGFALNVVAQQPENSTTVLSRRYTLTIPDGWIATTDIPWDYDLRNYDAALPTILRASFPVVGEELMVVDSETTLELLNDPLYSILQENFAGAVLITGAIHESQFTASFGISPSDLVNTALTDASGTGLWGLEYSYQEVAVGTLSGVRGYVEVNNITFNTYYLLDEENNLYVVTGVAGINYKSELEEIVNSMEHHIFTEEELFDPENLTQPFLFEDFSVQFPAGWWNSALLTLTFDNTSLLVFHDFQDVQTVYASATNSNSLQGSGAIVISLNRADKNRFESSDLYHEDGSVNIEALSDELSNSGFPESTLSAEIWSGSNGLQGIIYQQTTNDGGLTGYFLWVNTGTNTIELGAWMDPTHFDSYKELMDAVFQTISLERTEDSIIFSGPPNLGLVIHNSDWETLYPNGLVQEFDGVAMVLVPAGCFMMGSLDGDGDEQPVHEQCFEEPFWIDRYEVTNAQFEAFAGVAFYGSHWTDPDRPREPITWFDARDFCEKRGARLPTEREWEYAARGPDNLIYPWGNEWNTNNAVWNRSGSEGIANVGSIEAGISWVGAYDMIGNVWEWTSTIYKDYPYSNDDGRESNEDTNSNRVLRGGSWTFSDTYLLRAAYRDWSHPGSELNYFGFRCARSLEETTSTPLLEASENVVVRSEPRIGTNQIGEIHLGLQYVVEGKNRNSLWLQINFEEQTGWVCASDIHLINESLMFEVPTTDQSTDDCAGGSTASPTDELRLVTSCYINPYTYEFIYSDPSNQLNLIHISASGALLELLEMLLNTVGLGVDVIEAGTVPIADEVIINVWHDPLNGGYFVEVVRKNNDQVISTDLQSIDLTKTPICGVSAG